MADLIDGIVGLGRNLVRRGVEVHGCFRDDIAKGIRYADEGVELFGDDSTIHLQEILFIYFKLVCLSFLSVE